MCVGNAFWVETDLGLPYFNLECARNENAKFETSSHFLCFNNSVALCAVSSLCSNSSLNGPKKRVRDIVNGWRLGRGADMKGTTPTACAGMKKNLISLPNVHLGEFSENMNTALGQAKDSLPSSSLSSVLKWWVTLRWEGRFGPWIEHIFPGLNFLQRWNCFWQKTSRTWEVMRGDPVYFLLRMTEVRRYSLTRLRAIPGGHPPLSPV